MRNKFQYVSPWYKCFLHKVQIFFFLAPDMCFWLAINFFLFLIHQGLKGFLHWGVGGQTLKLVVTIFDLRITKHASTTNHKPRREGYLAGNIGRINCLFWGSSHSLVSCNYLLCLLLLPIFNYKIFASYILNHIIL